MPPGDAIEDLLEVLEVVRLHNWDSDVAVVWQLGEEWFWQCAEGLERAVVLLAQCCYLCAITWRCQSMADVQHTGGVELAVGGCCLLGLWEEGLQVGLKPILLGV